MSRTISVPFVMIESGIGRCASISRVRRVTRYRPSPGWYGSVLVPSATLPSRGRRSSRPRTSGKLTLTSISLSKPAPGSRSIRRK